MRMKKLGKTHHKKDQGGWKFETEEKPDPELAENMVTYFGVIPCQDKEKKGQRQKSTFL